METNRILGAMYKARQLRNTLADLARLPDDNKYKKAVLQLLSQNFSWDKTLPVGTLSLVHSDQDTVECDLVLMNDWKDPITLFHFAVAPVCIRKPSVH